MVIHRSQDQPLRQAGEVHALVLAAGAGTRMGGDKLRRLWRGRPLIAWAVDAALAAPVRRVWVVSGGDPDLATLLPPDPRLQAIRAEDWALGLSASLKAGLAAASGRAAAALVFLGDMPLIPTSLSEQLVQAWRDGADAAAPLACGRRGHPVLLDASLFPAVGALQGDRGAGALLEGLGGRLALVQTDDEGVLFDVDTPELLAS